jgi:hypothetical protein
LLLLLDESVLEQKIELYKNVQDYDRCRAIINCLDNDFAWLKEIFINQCNAKNRWMVELEGY